MQAGRPSELLGRSYGKWARSLSGSTERPGLSSLSCPPRAQVSTRDQDVRCGHESGPGSNLRGRSLSGSGDRIRTCDLWVVSRLVHLCLSRATQLEYRARLLNALCGNALRHRWAIRSRCVIALRGPRVHMQDLVSAINGGAEIWMAGAGRETVNSYPEAQAVAYAQWFSHAFSLWEEQFRGRIAAWFDKRTPERIRGSDIRSDYFGDIRLIRNDFVHNRGICKDSSQLRRLEYGLTRRRPIEITPEQMLSLIDLFPRDELRSAPTPLRPGDTVRVPGKVNPHVLEDVQTRAQQLGLNDSQVLETALSEWLARNGS